MKEFNLSDLAQTTHKALDGSPDLSVKDVQQILEAAFTEMHKNCVEQVEAGAKVGRFEQNFGPYPFTLRVKKVSPKKGGFGDNGIPARYALNVRAGKAYPKP